MNRDIARVLLTEKEIQNRVKELGAKITADYRDKNLLLVAILNGSVVFLSDLMRQIDIPLHIDFMKVSSYGSSARTSGVVKIVKDLDRDIANFDVLIVEDIIDSGVTLSHLYQMFQNRGPSSIKICCLLNKPDRRTADIAVDYVGFDIPDEFVVGYGLDYAEHYRNLPYIGILKREIYE